MEYYSVIKRNEVLIQATAWMNHENMMLSESQTQKATYCMICLYKMCPMGKTIDTESRLMVEG